MNRRLLPTAVLGLTCVLTCVPVSCTSDHDQTAKSNRGKAATPDRREAVVPGMSWPEAKEILEAHGARDIHLYLSYITASHIDGKPTYVSDEYYRLNSGIVVRLCLDTEPTPPVIMHIDRADSAEKLGNKQETWSRLEVIDFRSTADPAETGDL